MITDIKNSLLYNIEWMITKINKTSLLWLKQLNFLACIPIRFVNMLTATRFNAIKHLPDKECLINLIWKNSAVLFLMSLKFPKIRNLISYIQGSPPKNSWMTLLDKLSICKVENLNMLPIFLLQMLLQESISKEKDCKYYWTPAYKKLSENLLLPTETGFAGSDLNCCNNSLPRVEEPSQCLMMKQIRVQNRNLLKTYFQLSTSTVADKWEKEATLPKELVKALKIKMKPSKQQRVILDEWINTSNYVYNKTVETIYKKKQPANFQSLRDLLVTANTKKHNLEYITISNKIKQLGSEKYILKKTLLKIAKTDLPRSRELIQEIIEKESSIKAENAFLRSTAKSLSSQKNDGIHEWELKTPKEVRAGSVNDVCKAIKTGISNLKAGNIKYFRLGFRKRKENYKSAVIPKNFLKNNYGTIQIAPEFFKENCKFKMGKKTIKKHKMLEINYDSRIVKQMNEYWLIVPISVKIQEKTAPVNYCGIDPGSRTFMTSFGNEGCMEYKHNDSKLKIMDAKIKTLKNKPKKTYNRVSKSKIIKIERKKEYLINEIHWKTINHLLKTNDFIFYGNIKSHGIVKNGKNRNLNTSMNNLKFYKFKERLLFKAVERNKQVFLVNEAYTTQTCSNCGSNNKPGCSSVYSCRNCKKKVGRDVNAAKNILMKGIIENL